MVSLLGYNEGYNLGYSARLNFMVMDTDSIYSFGAWIKQRRRALRFTQRELAARAHCSVAMIKKIEADERQPSPELAELLAEALQIAPEQRAQFVETARGQALVDRLPSDPGLVASEAAFGSLPGPAVLNLPRMATPFIGREQELAAIAGRLQEADCRLLTLLGPGGIGKTRLALETASRSEGRHASGVGFVPLAAVATTAELPGAIAKALNLSLVGPAGPEEGLKRFLVRREMLLVLDNFEHIVAGAPLLADLLAAAPALKLLVTSRERLNLAGECLFPVPGFDREQAAQLFTQQARRVQAGFDPAGSAAAIDEICRLVGGHPLAVELAASWARLMSPAQIAGQIAQDLDFLTGGARDVPTRHQSLRALFDHSWALLSSAEREVLAKLSVFRGGFAQEQAATVAGASWPLLLGLVDKSLVEALHEQDQGSAKAGVEQRFGLHELVGQYAADQLAASGAEQAARRQHFSVYGRLARELAEQRLGPRAIISANRFELELDNFHAALDWGLAQGWVEEVLVFTEDLFYSWLRGGHWRAGEKWMRAAIAPMGDADSGLLCSALCRLATFMAIQGRYMEAMPLSQRAIPMARRLGEPWPLVITNNLLAQASTDMEEVAAAYEQVIAICLEHDSYPYDAFLCDALRLYGDRLLNYGDYVEAEARTRESLELLRARGDVDMIAYPLGNLGRIALLNGRLAEAEALIAESVSFARGGRNRVSMGDWLFRLGLVHLYQGELAAAEAELQEAAALYEEIGNPRGRADVFSCLAEVALARDDLDQAAAYIHDCLSYYQGLYDSMKGLLDDYGFTAFRDVVDDFQRAGLVKTAQEDYETAALIFAAVKFFQERHRYQLIQPLAERVTAAQAQVRDHLSVETWQTAQARGEQMTLDEVLALILS